MRQLVMTLGAAAAFIVAGSASNRAEAISLNGVSGIRDAQEELNVVDQVQYYYGGRQYCWYDNGWNGPGWYWCGRYLTPGIGWAAAMATADGVVVIMEAAWVASAWVASGRGSRRWRGSRR